MLIDDAKSLTGQIAATMADLYISEWERYVLMLKCGDGQCKYLAAKKVDGSFNKLTMSVVNRHVMGILTIAIFAHKNSSKFLCFDIDDGNKETVRQVIDGLVEEGFIREKIYVSSSGGKGYHVEIFFDRQMPTDLLRGVYNRVCDSKGLNKTKVEFRPTSKQAIKLPLSYNKKTGNRCWYVNPETFEAYETTSYILQIEKHCGDDYWKQMFARLPVYQSPKRRNKASSSADDSKSVGELIKGKNYLMLTEPHTFRKTACKVAVFIRKSGRCRTFEELQNELEAWYYSQDRSLIRESENDALVNLFHLATWAWNSVEALEPEQHPDGTVTYERKKEKFDQIELSTILSADYYARRWLLFYILWKEKSYGTAIVSYDKLAELLGRNTKKTVIKHIARLKESTILDIDPGGVRLYEGQRRLYANTYHVYTFNEPDESIPFLVDEVAIPSLDTHDLRKTYYETLLQAINHKWLERHLQKDELTYITEELGYEL